MMRRILLSTRASVSPIRRALSSTVSPADAANLQKMSARLTLENTYLSYTRNAVISTVAGGARALLEDDFIPPDGPAPFIAT